MLNTNRKNKTCLVICVHSYRGGVGKTNIVMSIAAILSARGLCVGVMDLDIISPGAHVLLQTNGFDTSDRTLNEYLRGKCRLHDVARDVTDKMGESAVGKVYFFPCSPSPSDISLILRRGYDIEKLMNGQREVVRDFGIDVLLLDTHPGLNDETLLSMAVTDVLMLILRPDAQDFQGTSVTVEVANHLSVPALVLLINKVQDGVNKEELGKKVGELYGKPVVGVLSHTHELLDLASYGIFAVAYKDHPFCEDLNRVVDALLAVDCKGK